MARTTAMRLVELMVLKNDVDTVVQFLGKKGNFQFQDKKNTSEVERSTDNPAGDMYNNLQTARIFLGNEDFTQEDLETASMPTEEMAREAEKLLDEVEALKKRLISRSDETKRIRDALTEAKSFANLKVSFSELDHLSFMTMRIGHIDGKVYDDLVAALGASAIVVPLGDDRSRVLVATGKSSKIAIDTELKKFNFVNLEIPEDFKGVPDDVLESLSSDLEKNQKKLSELEEEKANLGETHADLLKKLLASYSLAAQIQNVKNRLESTSLVYRITGWIPDADCHQMMKDLDKLTESRTAIRVYQPHEVPSVLSGEEKVPVQLKHGKLVGAFERMIFSYGSPLYGNIDPTPFVAVFFTLLFGIMFGDAGQGLVFLIAGILMSLGIIKVGGWNKFAPIFMAIGCTSMVMGFLTGEFFANSKILLPLSAAVKGLFGVTDPEKLAEPILEMMPSAERIVDMFLFFLFTILVGFCINSVGLIINIANQFHHKKTARALFGKSALSGALFFWYVVVLVARIVLFKHSPALYDWIVIGVLVALTAFSEPLIRLAEGERPVLENGLFAALIEAVVEVLELVSNYLSNSISFVRVGAFALAHAVLGYIISTMSALAPLPGQIAIYIIGNAIVIVLEGMIVAIQVIRLQYYEFFSKFFNETGREFKPFAFEYKALVR